MFEFMFGAACLVGLAAVVRGGRRGGCHGGRGRRHGWHADGARRGRRAGFARAAGEVFKRRLDVDPDQEDIVDHALADLRDSLEALGATLHDSRAALSQAFAGEEVDQARLDAVWARHDEAVALARREVVSALKQIHAVLDPEQRALAASWLADAQPGWR